jgi:uncharacterized membrane protein YhaH (DUF805 family)
MSKPVFEDLFSFSGRRNRQSYIFLGLALIAGMFVALSIIGVGAATDSAIGPLLIGLGVISFIPMAVIGWASASQRVRDFGQSGAWVLVTLIPYVGFAFSLALMVIPGTEGDNKYGPSCIK